MILLLIRHAATPGNLLKRYIGSTDEALSDSGISSAISLSSRLPLQPSLIFSSPLLRCRQTANLLFPYATPSIIHDFRETNFGDFENKSFLDLQYDPAYIHWLDSGGSAPFPGGESPDDCAARILPAFDSLLHSLSSLPAPLCVAIVAHGGTIMTIMHNRALPHRDFYSWHLNNCSGFVSRTNFPPLSLSLISTFGP